MVKARISENPLDDGFIPRQKWFVQKIFEYVEGFTLDCGCGRGLWSEKLRDKGINVVSLDLSLRRLKMCKRDGKNDRVICATCTRLPFKSNCFDSVLLLETIEHISQKDQYIALREIHSVLKKDGILVMTTPNKPIYRILTKWFFKHNPEHLHELTYDEAKLILKKYFSILKIDGKIGFLDKLVPSRLCWDLLFVCKKLSRLPADRSSAD